MRINSTSHPLNLCSQRDPTTALRARAGLVFLWILLLAAAPLLAQPELRGTAETKLALERLRVLGTMLMIGAHPDDENSALLAYFARRENLRTAYLSLTRGEGGQNLIGPERGDLMGVIRTQELLAARRMDGAEQYFTRAIDFGYSKTAEETLAKWGKQEVLGDVVWVVRNLRPDIIVLEFSPTGLSGHGHHQSSAILGKEAFRAAADPKSFPEQLKWVKPWQAKHIFWNVRGPRPGSASETSGRVEVDAGEYNPVLGVSYAEIAGMSRSMHRSQGFGAPQRKGSAPNILALVDGEPAESAPLAGVDTTWSRVRGGSEIGRILERAAGAFEPEHPEKIVPLLLEARERMAGLHDPWVERKRAELDEAIALAAGLWMEPAAGQYAVAPGGKLNIEAEILNRSRYPLQLISVELDGAGTVMVNQPLAYNDPLRRTLEWNVPATEPYTHPHWLREPREGEIYTISDRSKAGEADTEPALTARFRIRAGSQEIEFRRPVLYRYVDRVRGELRRPLTVTPPISVEFMQEAMLFPSKAPREVEVLLRANQDGMEGDLRLELPDGWSASPGSRGFQLASEGEQAVLAFEVTPPQVPAYAEAQAVARVGDTDIAAGTRVIEYEHIPPQTLSPPARVKLVRVDAQTLARRVAYVMGAGDDVPQALQELGCRVTLLEPEDVARADLSGYDAIVTGVRAYNVRPDLPANQQRLLDYVKQGGTLIVQYNVISRFRGGGNQNPLEKIGPYPLRIGSSRVSVEEAPMRFLKPDHPVMQAPNRITEADFEGWVQERGLYFAQQWDERYEPLWEASDPGESSLAGGTLYARYGKGVYVFTGLSWFRQLPAGVPGAYRIFANLLSAGKTIQ